MMKTRGIIVFIAVSILLLQAVRVDAGGKRWPERLRERIKQRRLDRGNLRPGSRDETRSLAHDGLTRTYGVHLPPYYDGKTPAPVVLYLHGGGGSMTAAYKDGMDKASDKFGFVLVIPTGTGPIPDRLLTWNGGTWSRHAGEEAFESCCGYAARNNIDDVGFISKVIEEVKENFNVDENRIYATGISNGGLMSYRLACELSDKIAAIAPVAPPAVSAVCLPQRPVPVMHIHGTADPCAPYDGGVGGGCLGSEKHQMQSAKEMVDRWKNINECSGDSDITYQKADATCVRYDQCAGGAAVEFCTVEGGGHAWPGGEQYLPADRIGPVSYDISFDQMWEFLKEYSLPGASSSSVAAGDYDFSLEHDGLERTYNVHVPPGYDGKAPATVVLNFHGGGGTAEVAQEQAGMNSKADLAGYIAVYPEGVSVIGVPGKRQHWNAGARAEYRNQQVDDVGFVSAMLDQLEKDFSVDTKRVYATGLSNGAMMSYRLACELSGRIAAIATVGAGMVFEGCNPMRPVSVMHFHGTSDPGWPYSGGNGCFTKDLFEPVEQTISQWTGLNRCSAASVVSYRNGDVSCRRHACAEGSEVTLCRVEDGGHTWPGGSVSFWEQMLTWDEDCALGEGRGVGEITRDIVATDAMWEFFKKHPLP